MNQIQSWNNPAPIIIPKDKLRTFSPVVLFHEHNSIEECSKIHTGDEHHGEFIRTIKRRVDEMLLMNSRDWMMIAEKSNHLDLTMKPKRRRGNLPKAVTALLKDWLAKHKKHPYPTEEEKLLLSKETKLSLQQISNWFINARRRHLPHLLENEHSSNQPAPELDIYPYEATESADSDNRLRCSSRINNKTGGIKKSKTYNLQQHKRKLSTL